MWSGFHHDVIESSMFGNVFERENRREFMKYAGDYSLFFSGFFPEFLERKMIKGMCKRVGKNYYLFLDKIDKEAGRKSLFYELSSEFEKCSNGIYMIREKADNNKEFPLPKII